MSYKGECRICKQINNDSKYMYAERKKKKTKNTNAQVWMGALSRW